MAVLKSISLFSLLILTSCHFSYLAKGGYYQAKMLSRQISIERVLQENDLKPEVRHKLSLALDVMEFAKKGLELDTKGNYKNYVKLDQPYVTYAVTAAEKFSLKPFVWNFPLVGSVPYKGHFVKEDADEEARELREQGYDVLVRGVSAYSTLGWIKDPILSSMLNYRDEDFVNLLIHESVHANVYVKSSADFNEQLATFLANKGSEEFFRSHELLKTSALQYTQDSENDDKAFSKFLSAEWTHLEEFYKTNQSEESKRKKLNEIQQRFTKELLPLLKTATYKRFGEEELNNAVLISYKTYLMDLSDFETVFKKFDSNFKHFLNFCKTLEKSDNPKKDFLSALL